MKIAILIVSYHAKKYLPDLLESLQKLDTDGLDVQTIFVDNSSDDTADVIEREYPQSIVLRQKENTGFAEGNNIGMRYALAQHTDAVVLLNQDTFVEHHWLQELVRVAWSDARIGSVQALIRLYPDRDKLNSTGNLLHFLGFGFCRDYREYVEKARQYADASDIVYGSGAAVLYKADVLRAVGLFDKDFFLYHEDTDLALRARLAGWRNVLAPRAVVYHKYEFSRSIKKYYWMERNRWWIMLLFLRWRTLFLLLPTLLLMEFGQFGFSLARGWWKEKLQVYAWLLNPAHWPLLHAKRRLRQDLRIITDKELTRDWVGIISYQEIANPILDKVVNPVFDGYWHIVRKLMQW